MPRFIARICYAQGCKCKSTSSYYIPTLGRSAYLCVKCSRLVMDGLVDLKPNCPKQDL